MSTGQSNDVQAVRSGVERAMGELCMKFSGLEITVPCAIGYFVSRDVAAGQIIAAEAGFKAKVALFSSFFLLHTSDPTAAARLKEFRRHADKAESRRNGLIHSFYWPGGSPGAVRRIKMTAKPAKGLKMEFEEITPRHVEAAIEQLNKETPPMEVGGG